MTFEPCTDEALADARESYARAGILTRPAVPVDTPRARISALPALRLAFALFAVAGLGWVAFSAPPILVIGLAPAGMRLGHDIADALLALAAQADELALEA